MVSPPPSPKVPWQSPAMSWGVDRREDGGASVYSPGEEPTAWRRAASLPGAMRWGVGLLTTEFFLEKVREVGSSHRVFQELPEAEGP